MQREVKERQTCCCNHAGILCSGGVKCHDELAASIERLDEVWSQRLFSVEKRTLQLHADVERSLAGLAAHSKRMDLQGAEHRALWIASFHPPHAAATTATASSNDVFPDAGRAFVTPDAITARSSSYANDPAACDDGVRAPVDATCASSSAMASRWKRTCEQWDRFVSLIEAEGALEPGPLREDRPAKLRVLQSLPIFRVVAAELERLRAAVLEEHSAPSPPMEPFRRESANPGGAAHSSDPRAPVPKSDGIPRRGKPVSSEASSWPQPSAATPQPQPSPWNAAAQTTSNDDDDGPTRPPSSPSFPERKNVGPRAAAAEKLQRRGHPTTPLQQQGLAVRRQPLSSRGAGGSDDLMCFVPQLGADFGPSRRTSPNRGTGAALQGVVVHRLVRGGPLERAGCLPGDVVTGVDGVTILDAVHLLDVMEQQGRGVLRHEVCVLPNGRCSPVPVVVNVQTGATTR